MPIQAVARPTGPDFSGEWVLITPEKPAADAATTLSVKQPVTDKNVYGAPMPPAYLELTVERRSATSTNSRKYIVGAGGSTSDFGSRGPQAETRWSVTLEGESLIIAESSLSARTDGALGLDRQRTETWRLDREGSLVVTIVERQGDRESRDTLTYRRR